jgi:hypothetical protein
MAFDGKVFVFRPAGIQQDNVFTNWETLVDAMLTVEGRKILEFDDSLQSPCVIPRVPDGRAAWQMKDVSWAGFGPRPGQFRPFVDILEGARFSDFRMIGGQITIMNRAITTSPVSDFKNGDHVHIGLRDDAGTSELNNPGEAPLFHVEANGAFFFIQNCVFGVGLKSPHPLIQYVIPAGTPPPLKALALNLLGLNQTGERVVKAGNGAPVLFGAQSSAARFGADQSLITNSGGVLRFLPAGRIQRQVLPLPPAPPATGPLAPDPQTQFFTLPNVILRCDGRPPGFVQVLPRIADGFTMGQAAVPVYSGGQEVVVAELEGGPRLRVSPFPGDKIDGALGAEVRIAPHGSRTFLSDGVDNWISISVAS